MTQETHNKKPIQDNFDMYGLIPPQAVEVEEIVIGSIIYESDCLIRILDIIIPECFYKQNHQIIYKKTVELFNSNKPIDLLTITEELKKSEQLEEIGGPFYLSQLMSKVGSTANIEFHAGIIYEKYIFRQLIKIGSEMQRNSFKDECDFLEIINSSQQQLFDLLQRKGKRSRHIGEIARQRIEEIQHNADNNIEFTGIPTGFKKIDLLTNGWQKSNLIIIAARPSMGKTSIAMEFALRTAKKGGVIDVYSIEMKDTELVDKTISSETKISNTVLRTAKLSDQEWEMLSYKTNGFENLQIFIDDTPALDITDFNAKIRRNKKQNKTDLIIIDYLQLMKSPEAFKKGGRLGEVSDISSKLKAAAKELDVPVIALSQLSRDVEKRGGDKKPQLSDLRESGTIEQDADIVLFIHRPEHYGIQQDSHGNTTTNLIELIFAKNRNGHVGSLNIWKNNDWTEYRESETEENYIPTQNDFLY